MTTAELDVARAAWDTIAPGYDALVTPTGGWALPREALHRAGLRPGMRFLDVASGSGALALSAARLGAKVTAVDLSPVMIEHLQARARDEDITELDARVMDGHALELEDDSFDVAGSQFGVMLFPDLPRALAEMVRVTRPGGRVFMVAFGPPGEVEFLTFFVAAIQAVVPGFTGLPTDPPPLPFQVADPERLRTVMTDAGLHDVQIVAGVERLEVRSGKHLWDWIMSSNPVAGQLVADLTEAQKSTVQQVLDGMLRDRSGGRPGGTLDARVNIAVGTT